MKEVPSAEFRKTYHRLTEPVLVTVSGHTIGEYRPRVTVYSDASETTVYPAWDPDAESKGRPATPLEKAAVDWASGRSPEFRPAPKPSAKKR